MSENPHYPSGRVHADGVILSNRRRFVAKVYTLVIVYIILTCVQTLPILFVQDARDFLQEQRNLIYIVLVFFVMTVLLFFNFHDVRVVSPYNIIILLLLLEAATFVIMILVAPFDERDIALSFGISAAICITVSFIAAITTCDITRQIVFLMLWLILLFVVSIIIIVVTIFKPSKELMIAFSVFAISGVVVFLFYHTQTVIGGRIAQIRLEEHLYSSVIVFIDFVSIFVLILIIFEPTVSTKS